MNEETWGFLFLEFLSLSNEGMGAVCLLRNMEKNSGNMGEDDQEHRRCGIIQFGFNYIKERGKMN